jgi:energy-coupling factor transport system permease protein
VKDTIAFKASKPDPRVWLFLVIIVSSLTFLCGSRIELFSLFAMLALVMAWQKMITPAAYFVKFYGVLLLRNECLWLLE